MPKPPSGVSASCKESARPLSIDQVYDLYAPQVLRWASRLGGPELDSEDVLHDVFVVAVRRYPEANTANRLAYVTTDGQVTECPQLAPNSYPNAIVRGPDGNLWFTETGTNKIAHTNPR